MQRSPEINRHYAKVANFPKRLANLSARIVELRDEARDLGFTEYVPLLSALSTFANCLPEPPPKLEQWSDFEVAQLKKLWAEGLIAKDIAAKIGRSRAAVMGAVRRHGLPKRRKGKCNTTATTGAPARRHG